MLQLAYQVGLSLSTFAYEPPIELREAMNRLAPTVLGGSKLKQSPDFGQRKTSDVWEAMTLITTRWGELSPDPDHRGPILPANGLIAALQGFPGDWKFRGEPHPVFRQIGNAFPPIVALHLGCAIASALTGEQHDYLRAVGLQGTRYRLPPVQSVNADGSPREQTPPASALRPRVRDLGIKRLASTSSVLDREEGTEHLHESVEPSQDLEAGTEVEHHVWYWEERIEEGNAEGLSTSAGSSEQIALAA